MWCGEVRYGKVRFGKVWFGKVSYKLPGLNAGFFYVIFLNTFLFHVAIHLLHGNQMA